MLIQLGGTELSALNLGDHSTWMKQNYWIKIVDSRLKKNLIPDQIFLNLVSATEVILIGTTHHSVLFCRENGLHSLYCFAHHFQNLILAPSSGSSSHSLPLFHQFSLENAH